MKARTEKSPGHSGMIHCKPFFSTGSTQDFFPGPRVQPKLIIGAPNDKYEQEADDRVADQVMHSRSTFFGASMLEPQVQRRPIEEEEIQAKPIAEQITPLVQRQAEEESKPLATITPTPIQCKAVPEEEEEELQAKAQGGHTPAVSHTTQTKIQALEGGGRGLSQSERAFFEPRFGHDFSQVKIHTDARAGETTKAVNADAFTLGQDVVFGTGRYAPETMSGRRLLAHELTHVVQQNGGSGSGVRYKRARNAVPLLQRKGIEKTLKGQMGTFEINMEDEIESRRIGPQTVSWGGLDGWIGFTPSVAASVPDADKIGLVQIARTIDDETGQAIKRTDTYKGVTMPAETQTQKDKAKGIEGGYFVDVRYREILAGIEPASKFYYGGGWRGKRDVKRGGKDVIKAGKKVTVQDQHGFKKGQRVNPAILTDAPGWWKSSTFSFETYAQSNGVTYGGISWGFSLTSEEPFSSRPLSLAKGIVKAKVVPTTQKLIPTLSPTAADAIKRFEKFFVPLAKKLASTKASKSPSSAVGGALSVSVGGAGGGGKSRFTGVVAGDLFLRKLSTLRLGVRGIYLTPEHLLVGATLGGRLQHKTVPVFFDIEAGVVAEVTPSDQAERLTRDFALFISAGVGGQLAGSRYFWRAGGFVIISDEKMKGEKGTVQGGGTIGLGSRF